jgi:two-component sensor histidine kinase
VVANIESKQEKLQTAKINFGFKAGIGSILFLLAFIVYDKKTKLTTRLDRPLFGLNRQERRIKTFIKEKHHRSKNNIQVLLSAIEKKMRLISSVSDLSIINYLRGILYLVLQVNIKLGDAREGFITDIELEEFVDKTIRKLAQVYSYADLKYSFKTKKIIVDESIIIPYGLVINEVLMAFLDHALPEEEHPILLITMKKKGRILRVHIQSNGKPLKIGYDRCIGLLRQELDCYVKTNYKQSYAEIILKIPKPGQPLVLES